MTVSKSSYRLGRQDVEIRQQRVTAIIDRLSVWERQTNPVDGETSAKGKNLKAQAALIAANSLVELLAGWAQDHVYGLSAIEERFARNVCVVVSDEDAAALDSHEYEISGARLSDSDIRGLELAKRRMIIRNMLQVNQICIAREEMVDALDGLAYGEAAPILQATKTKRKINYAEMLLQLHVISIARFHGAMLGNVARGLQIAADAMRVDVETVRSWEKRLGNDLGRLRVAGTLQSARSDAEIVMHIERSKLRGVPDYMEEGTREIIMGHYGFEMLASLAAAYKKNRHS